MLIKIGDFAKEGGVSVKALRHYEKLGLLQPAWVNRFNGYRYYAPEQLDRLDLLQAYKHAGLPLKQIAALLDTQLSERDFCSILERHAQTLQCQAAAVQNRLAVIAACRACLQTGGTRSDVERSLSTRKHSLISEKMEETLNIPIKSLPAMKLVGLRYEGKNEHNEIAESWTAFNQRSHAIKNVINEAAYGVCFIPDGLPEGEFAYLCAFPVSEFRDIPAGMATLELEPMQAAVFEHRGAYETLGKTYANIYQKWLPEAGFKVLKKGLDMEVYTDAFNNFAPDSVMYIYVPIQAQRSPG